jgi:hypothetical protein
MLESAKKTFYKPVNLMKLVYGPLEEKEKENKEKDRFGKK